MTNSCVLLKHLIEHSENKIFTNFENEVGTLNAPVQHQTSIALQVFQTTRAELKHSQQPTLCAQWLDVHINET